MPNGKSAKRDCARTVIRASKPERQFQEGACPTRLAPFFIKENVVGETTEKNTIRNDK